MVESFVKAVQQLSDKRIAGVILGSLLATVALYAATWSLAWWLLGDLQVSDWGWLNWLVEFLAFAGVVVLSLLAFSMFVSIISSLFLERVADAVEDRHYAGLPEVRGQPLWASVRIALKFTGLVILLNLAALPLYLVFIFLPPLSLALFYVLNGYLAGREYFELVGLRRLDEPAARRLRRANGGVLFVSGVVITLLSTIPIVNFLTPVLAAAFMTHVFHGLKRPAAA